MANPLYEIGRKWILNGDVPFVAADRYRDAWPTDPRFWPRLEDLNNAWRLVKDGWRRAPGDDSTIIRVNRRVPDIVKKLRVDYGLRSAMILFTRARR